MKFYKVMMIVLCLVMLLSLAACVEAKAEGQKGGAAAPGITLPSTEAPSDTPLSHKTPVDTVEGKNPPEAPAEKNTRFTDDETLDFSEDYDPGLIPVPRPVEPPVEEQSEESSAAEE